MNQFQPSKALTECLKLVNEEQLTRIIHSLWNLGKLHQAEFLDYNREEWKMIYNYCKKKEPLSNKSLNHWSWNNPVILEECTKVINNIRKGKKQLKKIFD